MVCVHPLVFAKEHKIRKANVIPFSAEMVESLLFTCGRHEQLFSVIGLIGLAI
jgi:hypothetical protein